MWLKIINLIDRFIDSITMYRLLLYYLIALIIAAIGLSSLKIIHYNPIYIGVSAVVLVMACWLINKALAAFFQAPTNPESSILTGLILALILPPVPTGNTLLLMLAASGLAMASKYVLSIRRKHIFNPAAVAILLTAIGPHQSASWWVGTSSMLPIVIIGGILIARKIQKFSMIASYLMATTLAVIIFSLIGHTPLITNLKFMVLYSPVFFLGFVMLSEPYTSPTTRLKQIIYACLVGVIIAPELHIGHYYSSPEFALIIGNIFAYLVSSKTKLFPKLYSKREIAKDIAEFEFVPEQKLSFLPGQYMEFTLPHSNPDNRGVRRYFTLVSSPTEKTLKIAVKFYDDSSSYKLNLQRIEPSTPIVASQLGGNFTLPGDSSRKLVFIAGGIGITPFRSMIKYLIDTNETRDIDLLYFVRSEADIAYKDDLEAARAKLGINTNYVLTSRTAQLGHRHVISSSMARDVIQTTASEPDMPLYYISGSHSMVESTKATLRQLGVERVNIKTDFFPGYA